MTVSSPAKKTRRSRDVPAKFAIFFFWVILILSQLLPSGANGQDGNGRSSQNAPRKARFFHSDNSAHTVTGWAWFVGSDGKDLGGSSYEEDKRSVHTGPNPLHN
ncbi:hypothetical protein NMG60_11018815 [Bertholletia excelsa]